MIIKETSKLFHHYFESFTPKEKAQFPLWLENELQGRKEKMWQWFQITWNGGSRLEAFQAIYSHQADINKTAESHLANQLTDEIELYLAIKNIKKHPFQKDIALAKEMLKRNDGQHFIHVRNKVKNRLESSSIRDATYYRAWYELDKLDREFNVLYPDRKDRYYQVNEQTWEIHESLYWAMGEIEKALIRIYRLRTKKLSINKSTLEILAYDTLQDFSKGDKLLGGKDHLLPRLLCRIFDSLSSETYIEEDEASQLVELFKKAAPLIRPEKCQTIFVLIFYPLNQRSFTAKDTYYLDKRIELYEWALDFNKKIIPINRYHYYNLVKLYLQKREMVDTKEEKDVWAEKAKNYLYQNKNRLPIEEREEAFRYVEVLYLYSLKKYQEIRKVFSEFSFKDKYYEIVYYTTWLQARYELNDGNRMDLVNQLINIYKKVKKAKNLSGNFQKAYMNKLRLFRKLIEAQPSKLEKLLKENFPHPAFIAS